MMRILKATIPLVALFISVGAVTAQADTQPDPKPVPLCSDPGRSCSVDRNCCSGNCDHGSCK